MGKHKKVIKYKDKISFKIGVTPSLTQAEIILFTATTFCTVLAVYYDIQFYMDEGQAADLETGLIWCIHKLVDGETVSALRLTQGVQDQDDDIMLYKSGVIHMEASSGTGYRAHRWSGKVGAMRELKDKDSLRIQHVLDQAATTVRFNGTCTIIIGTK